MQFKIVHWNVLNQDFSNNSNSGFPFANPKYLTWEHRYKNIHTILKLYNADIFSLVEVNDIMFTQLSNDFPNYNTVYLHKPNSNYGNVIFIRKNINFSNIQKITYNNQLAIYIDFVYNDKTYRYFTCHFKSKREFEVERFYFLRKIAEHITDTTILTGDFNSIPNHVIYSNCITDLGLIDTHKNIAYTTKKYRDSHVEETIDYIFVTPNIKYTVLNNFLYVDKTYLPNDNLPSDHLPLDILI